MKKIVVFTGAGVSADSGIATFRDSDGLWAHHRIQDVCTPEALKNNRRMVVDFYNARRREMIATEPNAGHRAIIKLSAKYDVKIVTQNIDDLHERAGSRDVTHLHGELRKLRSSLVDSDVITMDSWEQKLDARHPDGSLLRPFVVFFGEDVPMFDRCCEIVKIADILIVVGTSLAVYPAASLVHYVPKNIPIYLVDPGNPNTANITNKVIHIQEKSAIGLPQLVEELLIN